MDLNIFGKFKGTEMSVLTNTVTQRFKNEENLEIRIIKE